LSKSGTLHSVGGTETGACVKRRDPELGGRDRSPRLGYILLIGMRGGAGGGGWLCGLDGSLISVVATELA
jgi:hypothetical protein